MVSGEASADLPPPPGMAQVWYLFRVDAVPDGMTLVAFPAYNSDHQSGHHVALEAGKDVKSFQGYTPGLYALPTADAASLPDDDGALKALLESKGKLCLKKIPRLFTVPTSTGVREVTDVMHVTVTPAGCSTRLVKTVFAGEKGKPSGEGGVDAAGKRLPPPPFGRDLPDVSAAGFVLDGATANVAAAPATAPTTAPTHGPVGPEGTGAAGARPVVPPSEPARGGCAGCAVVSGASGWEAGLAALLVGLGLAARRRRDQA